MKKLTRPLVLAVLAASFFAFESCEKPLQPIGPEFEICETDPDPTGLVERWHFAQSSFSAPSQAPIRWKNGLLFTKNLTGSGDQTRLFFIDTATGDEIWQRDLPTPIHATWPMRLEGDDLFWTDWRAFYRHHLPTGATEKLFETPDSLWISKNFDLAEGRAVLIAQAVSSDPDDSEARYDLIEVDLKTGQNHTFFQQNGLRQIGDFWNVRQPKIWKNPAGELLVTMVIEREWVRAGDFSITTVRLADGSRVQDVPVSRGINDFPSLEIRDGIAFLSWRTGTEALEPFTGQRIWSRSMPVSGLFQLDSSGATGHLIGTWAEKIDAKTGRLIWKSALFEHFPFSPPHKISLFEGRIFVAANWLYVLDDATGCRLHDWRGPNGPGLNEAHFSSGGAVVDAAARSLFVGDAAGLICLKL